MSCLICLYLFCIIFIYSFFMCFPHFNDFFTSPRPLRCPLRPFILLNALLQASYIFDIFLSTSSYLYICPPIYIYMSISIFIHLSTYKLKQMDWNGKKIQVLLFGDYAFLCNLYGLSGPAGKFPCVWCTCSKDDIQMPLTKKA